MIVIDENFVGMWFVQISTDRDYMAALFRTPDGLQAHWRFRSREGARADAWDQHRKRWYAGLTSEPEADAIVACRRIAHDLAAQTRGEYWELVRGSSSIEECAEALLRAPFAHVRQWQQ